MNGTTSRDCLETPDARAAATAHAGCHAYAGCHAHARAPGLCGASGFDSGVGMGLVVAPATCPRERRRPQFKNVSWRSRGHGTLPFGIASIAAALFLAAAGCRRAPPDDLETEYGQRSETQFESSINGYSVLAGMFAKAGHTVSSRSDLTPALKDAADVIVYAPDDFAPPSATTVDWFELWLREKDGRTLIYIGRDFDAAPIYWRKIRSQVLPKQQLEVDRRLREAEEKFRSHRSAIPEDAECKWFSIDGTATHRDVRMIAGRWNVGIDPSKVEIELNSRIEASDNDAEMLLSAPKDADPGLLAFRRTFVPANYHGLRIFAPTSQLIVVANGSFLVNLQLVNKEHRKLAGKLIGEIEKPSRVVFMEADGPTRIRNSRGGGNQETAGMTDVFTIWPLSVILIQWIVVLALFCFSRWPIFGPPRDPPSPPASDFARHIGALAETWELTRDSSYAQARWQYYQQHVRGESGGLVAKRQSRSGK